jgi:hypothetical protein
MGRGRGEELTAEERAARDAERDNPFLEVLTTEQKEAYAKLKSAQTLDEELARQLQRPGRRGGGRRGGGGGL